MYTIKKLLLVLMSCAIVLVAVCITAVSYHLFSDTMLDSLSESHTDSLQLVSQKTDSIVTGSKTIAQLLSQNEDLIGTILSNELPTTGQSLMAGNLDLLYAQYNNAFSQIDLTFEILCFGENGFFYSSADKTQSDADYLQMLAWFEKNKNLFVSSYTITSFAFPTSDGANSHYFANVKNVFNSDGTFAGSVMVLVPESTLKDSYSSLYTVDNEISILSEDSLIISSSNPYLINTTPSYLSDYIFVRRDESDSIYENKEGALCLSAKYTSDITNWTIYEQIPLSTVMQPIRLIFIRLCLVVFLILAIALGISLFISNKISRPLQTFCDDMKHSVENNFQPVETICNLSEAVSIQHHYNQLCEEITTLVEDIRTSERNVNEAHFNFLKAQINPHFLYNTLFTIKCMVSLGEKERACEMISTFISLLKYSVDSNEESITLLDECIMIKQYVALQKLRDQEPLDFKINLPPHLTTRPILRFIIQPLVENVFLHAFSGEEDPATLLINFTQSDGDLIIEVCDNGSGFTQETLTQALTHGVPNTKSLHIGLRNIQERLELHYGNGYGLSVRSDPNFSSVVCLTLPLPEEESPYV